ncbi:hypothetical protein P3S67_000061 [Capsicum chacoense]
MGNCIILQEKVVKVIKTDGKILEYKAPIKVYQILSQFPGHVISNSLQIIDQNLLPNDDLLSGQIYYLLPQLPMHPPPKSPKKKVKFANDQVIKRVKFANDQVLEKVKFANDQVKFANDQANEMAKLANEKAKFSNDQVIKKVKFANDEGNEKAKIANDQVIQQVKFANYDQANEKVNFANDQVNEVVKFANYDQVNEKVNFANDQVELLEANDKKKEVIRVKIVITKKQLQELLSNESGLIKVDDIIKSTTTIVDENTNNGKGWKPILDIIHELD